MNSNQEQNNEETMDVDKTNSEEIQIDEQTIEIEERYKFGWLSLIHI